MFVFLNVFVNFIKCRRGAAGEEFIRKGCFGKLSHNFAPAKPAKLYQVWSKIISTKPNVDSRTWLKSALFPLKVVAIHNFFKTKLKKTSKKLRVSFNFSSNVLIMRDHPNKIVSALELFPPVAFEFAISIITKCKPSYLTFAKEPKSSQTGQASESYVCFAHKGKYWHICHYICKCCHLTKILANMLKLAQYIYTIGKWRKATFSWYLGDIFRNLCFSASVSIFKN